MFNKDNQSMFDDSHQEDSSVINGAQQPNQSSLPSDLGAEYLSENEVVMSDRQQVYDNPSIIKIQELIMLKDNICRLSNVIRQRLVDKYEPVDDILRLNHILDDKFEEVWQMVHTPIEVLQEKSLLQQFDGQRNQSQQQQILEEDRKNQLGQKNQNIEDQLFKQSPNTQREATQQDKDSNTSKVKQPQKPIMSVKIDFYDNVLGGISNLMLNELSIQKPPYVNEIFNFFRIIIAKFFSRDPLCQELTDIVSNLFDWEKTLHLKVLGNYNHSDVKNDQMMSLDHRRIQKEYNWRMDELKVGDRVDVIKRLQLKDCTIQAWNRGKVAFKGFTHDEDQKDDFGGHSNIESNNHSESMKIDIEYESDKESQIQRLEISDWRLAPLGTYTDDFDWRYDIKDGDLIDCMDSEKEWYKSTVLKTRYTQNLNGDLIKEVYVGFRTFDEEGSKADDRGRKFFGWSEKYDEWFCVTDPQIQRFGFCHQQYQKVESLNKVYHKFIFDDKEDVHYNSKNIQSFFVRRDKYFAKSYTIVDALNEFAHSGGIEKIMTRLQKTSLGYQKITIQELYSITQLFSRIMPLWHRRFSVTIIPEFKDLLLKTLSYINNQATESNKNQINLGVIQDENFQVNILETMLAHNNILDTILQRYYTNEMTEQLHIEFKLEIGTALLNVQNLQKRIVGIKYINEAIKLLRLTNNNNRLMTTEELINYIRKLGILGQIFGENTHYQLVHRSQDLIKLFFNEKEIQESEIDLIWNVCLKQGQQIKLEIYKIILEVLKQTYSTMTDQTKEYLIDKLTLKTPSQLIEKEIEIVTELGKKGGIAFRQPESFVIKAAKFLWSVAILEKDYPKQIALIARKKFCEQVQSWDDGLKVQYIADCINNISEQKHSLQNLKIAVKLIEKMNQSSYPAGKQTRQDFACDLSQTQDFAGIIIQDLENYIDFSNTLALKGELSLENQKTYISQENNNMFPHFKNLNSRLKKLKEFLNFSKEKLTSQQIEKIWDIMIIKSELRDNDQNIFFNWFKMLLGKDQKQYITEQLMIDLFRKKIVPSNLSMLKSLRVDGLECIVRLFVLVNEIQGNVLDLDPSNTFYSENNQQQSYAGYQGGFNYQTSTYYSYSYGNQQDNDNNQPNKSKFNRFRVNIMPQQLEGIKILWSLLEACDTGNQSLFKMVQGTLINIYSNLSQELNTSKQLINNHFMMECLNILQSINQDSLIKRNENQKKTSNEFICSMIKTFFESTEEGGLGKLRMHKQLEDGKFIKKIILENKVPCRKGIDATAIELKTYSNMTIWTLKTLISMNINASPLCINLKRGDKLTQINDSHNCKTLNDLKILDGEVIQITERFSNPVKVPLHNKEGEMLPELRTIILRWFETFSALLSKDDIIFIQNQSIYPIQLSKEDTDFINRNTPESGTRFMTKELCAEFTTAITSAENITFSDHRVSALFDKYSKKYPNKILLAEEEFLQFYSDCSKTKEDVVRQNLSHLKTGADLKPQIDNKKLNFDSDERIIKDQKILPRDQLSSNQNTFNQLLEIIENSNGDQVEGVINLISFLPTNKYIEQRIINNENIEEFLFDLEDDSNTSNIDLESGINQAQPKNLFRILYCIQILQSLIYEYKKKQACEIIIYREKTRTINNSDTENQNDEMQVDNYQQDFPSLSQVDETEQGVQFEKGNSVPEMAGEQINSQGGLDDNNYQENSRQNMADQNVAIPMPYSGPLTYEQNMLNQAFYGTQTAAGGYSYDIPLAPASLAAQIGPPNANNTGPPKENNNTDHKAASLASFSGSVIKVQIVNSPAKNSEEDEKRKQWLSIFMSKGGLEKLIQLFKNLAKCTSSQSTNSKQNSQLNTNNIAKQCLSAVMSCIKTLFVSSLLASSQKQDQTLNLENNLNNFQQLKEQPSEEDSQNQIQDGNQSHKKVNNQNSITNENINDPNLPKNKVEDVQQLFQEEFEPLVEFLKNKNIFLKDSLDLEKFQEELLGIISEFMGKKEDIEILSQGLSIWQSCLISEPKLFNKLQKLEGNTNIKSFDFSSKMIEEGLLCSADPTIRDQIYKKIKNIVSSVQSDEIKMPPLYFYIDLLLQKLDYVQHRCNTARYQTKFYFQILKELLQIYLQDQCKQIILFDQKMFIRSIVQRLIQYEASEKRSSFFEDHTLIGLLDIIRILLENDPDILESDENQTDSIVLSPELLAQIILEQCLFTTKFDPIDAHITQSIELDPIEKKLINKCLVRDSISAAYKLLLTLSKNKNAVGLSDKLLQFFWLNTISPIQKPQKSGFNPQSDGRSWNKYCGIKNLGAVCYMNSMLQQFYNVPTLRYCLLASDDKDPMNIKKHQGQEIDDNLLHQVKNMFGYLQLSDRQHYNPAPFCFSFKSFDGQPTNVREQKDAQEFLNVGIDKFEELLKNTSQKYLLKNVFGGQTCSIMKCKNCGNTRKNIEDFYNLSLEVKNQKNIYDGLKKLVAGEIISDYNCEACNKKVDLEKRLTIDKLPNTLIIHLQRITFDLDCLKNVKLNDRVEFPNVLNLKDFSAGEILKLEKMQKQKSLQKRQSQQNQNEQLINVPGNQSKNEDQKQDMNDEDSQIQQEFFEDDNEMIIDEEGAETPEEGDQLIQGFENNQEFIQNDQNSEAQNDFEFKLVGIVCHMGSADAGHYLSYINIERDKENSDTLMNKSKEAWLKTEKQDWLEFNDSNVSRFNCNLMEQSCFGDQQSNQNAYMLIYEKRIKEKMKVVILQDVMQALACDGTAMSSSNDIHLFQVFPNLQEQILSQKIKIQFDREKNEHFVMVDFDDARKFVPNSIYKMVHYDNKKFLCEKQVFSEQFFQSTLDLINLSISQEQDLANNIEKLKMLFFMLDKIIFELLVNCQANLTLKGMSEVLILLLAKSNDAVVDIVKNRIFANQESYGADEKNIFEMLCSHQSAEVRQMAANVFCFVLKRLIYIGGDENIKYVDQSLNKVLDQMPNECQKHWMKLEIYFTFIYDIVRSHPFFLISLCEKNIILRLFDLFVKYNPNQMIYVTQNPPFNKLVLTISFIARSFPCIIDLNDLNNFTNIQEELDKDTQMLILQEERGSSPYYQNFKENYPNIDLEELQYLLQQHKLPVESIRCLFVGQKLFKPFYENVSKLGYEYVEFSKIVAHLCYKNMEFSRKIAKHILKGTNSCISDDIYAYLELMKAFLSVEDEYFHLRIEWIFGIADLIVKSNNYQVYNQPPKLGVALADQVYSQINRYISPIFKTGTQLYGGKVCALQALFTNKQHQSRAVLLSLKIICEVILEDPQMRILKYFKSMDPPTYQFARYWDWIKPWILNKIQNVQKYANDQTKRAELEPAINVLSLIEQIELKDKKSNKNYHEEQQQKQLQQQQQQFVIEPEDDGGSRPYVMWDIHSIEEFDRKEDVDCKVTVQINQVTCNVSTSLPTGEHNFALIDVFGNNYSNVYQGIQGSTQGIQQNQKVNHRVIGRGSYGRGRKGSGNPQGGKHIVSQKVSGKKNKKQSQKEYKIKQNNKTNENVDNDADSEEGSGDLDEYNSADYVQVDNDKGETGCATSVPEQTNYQDDVQEAMGDQKSHGAVKPSSSASNVPHVEDPDRGINNTQNQSRSVRFVDIENDPSQPQNQQDDSQDKCIYQGNEPNQESDGQQIDSKGDQRFKDDEEAIQENSENDNEQNEEDQYNQDGGPQENMDQQDGGLQNLQRYKSKCLLIFKVENNSSLSKTVQVSIKPKNGHADSCNFKIPLSDITCEVYSNQNACIIHLAKLDPEIDDWGDFEWTFRIVNKNNNAYNSSYSNCNNNNNQITYSDNNCHAEWKDQPMGGINQSIDFYVGGSKPAVDDLSPSRVDDPQEAWNREKACSICTLSQATSNSICELCGSAF